MLHGGGFILLYNKPTGTFLVGLRNKETKFNPNTWCPFGGTIEENETPLHTAIRELKEETCIPQYKYNIRKTPIYIMTTEKCADGNTHHMYVYFAITDNEIPAIIDDETQDYKWAPLSQLVENNCHPIIPKIMFNDTAVNKIEKFIKTINFKPNLMEAIEKSKMLQFAKDQKNYILELYEEYCKKFGNINLDKYLNDFYFKDSAQQFRTKWENKNGNLETQEQYY
jgi:8-oxo-dGTP pyrophosphatase MutT (NUDIX family)